MRIGARIAAYALSVALALVVTGCASGGGSSGEIISAGYLPAEITNIDKGGEFDAASLTPHDSSGIPLEKLEGYWVYEGLADKAESGEWVDAESVAVTDRTIVFNDEGFECFPMDIDFRAISPVGELRSQGFGYGAAVFASAKKQNDTPEIAMIDTPLGMPYGYGGSGFIFTTNGNTLALGILGMGCALDEYGKITNGGSELLGESQALNECTLTELDYEANFEGDRLTLSYDGISATYVPESLHTGSLHETMWFGEPLYEGDNLLDILGRSPRDLLGKGYEIDCDFDELLPTCSVSDEIVVRTPGGSTLSAKLVNPYEKMVPTGFSRVCWYEYDGEEAGKLTVGRPSEYEWSHSAQEFGVTPYADVYNNYVLPYDAAQDFLLYKVGYGIRIVPATLPGDGYDTGNTVLETENSCDIRLGFEDNILSSISVSDSVYLNAGLQDNIAHDDLDYLKPSVYREVTEQRDEILDELKKSFREAGLDAAIDERTGEVVLDNGVLFATDSYELGEKGKAYLDEVFSAYASVVLDEKYSGALREVAFEGNTDSDGDSEYNMRLSDNRANAVMAYCSGLLDEGQRAVFDELASCRGYGESDLVYDENGYEDKDASRRVAIKFMVKVDGSAEGAESRQGGESATESSASEVGSSATGGSSSSDDVSGSGDEREEAGVDERVEAGAPEESSGDGGDADGSSSTTQTPQASSSSSSDAGDKQGETNELEKFNSISGNFDQAWILYEKPESEKEDSEHVAALLLSEDHSYCAYFDLTQDSTNVNGHYTFGETSVEEEGENTQWITVRHDDDADKLGVIFNAWKRDGLVSVKDPWGGVNDLTANDVEFVASLFEQILAP